LDFGYAESVLKVLLLGSRKVEGNFVKDVKHAVCETPQEELIGQQDLRGVQTRMVTSATGK
jgi:hypothetical protein